MTWITPMTRTCALFVLLMSGALSSEAAVSEATTADEALESKVEQRLRMEGRIRWDELKVEARQGQVTLYGIVKSNEERGFAEKAASTVQDVSSVQNKILVQPNMPYQQGAPNAGLNEQSRDRVLEGPPGLKDRQVMP